MKVNNIEVKIIKAAKKVHRCLGNKQLIQTYVACMIYELKYEQLKIYNKSFDDVHFSKSKDNELDGISLIVEGKVIVLIKNNASIEDFYYIKHFIMRSKKIKFGFIINFETNLSSNCLFKLISV